MVQQIGQKPQQVISTSQSQQTGNLTDFMNDRSRYMAQVLIDTAKFQNQDGSFNYKDLAQYLNEQAGSKKQKFIEALPASNETDARYNGNLTAQDLQKSFTRTGMAAENYRVELAKILAAVEGLPESNILQDNFDAMVALEAAKNPETLKNSNPRSRLGQEIR
jgi:hypothetical protein